MQVNCPFSLYISLLYFAKHKSSWSRKNSLDMFGSTAWVIHRYCWVHENSLQSKFPSQVKSLSGGKRLILSCDLRSPGGSEFQNDPLRPSQQKKENKRKFWHFANLQLPSDSLQWQEINYCFLFFSIFWSFWTFWGMGSPKVMTSHGAVHGVEALLRHWWRKRYSPRGPGARPPRFGDGFQTSRHPKNPENCQIVIGWGIGWGIGVMWFND